MNDNTTYHRLSNDCYSTPSSGDHGVVLAAHCTCVWPIQEDNKELQKKSGQAFLI